MKRNLKAVLARLSLWACVALLAGLASTTASAQPTLNLPSGPLSPTITFSTTLSLPSYFTTQFPSIPSGYDVKSAQTYLTWCAQENADLDFSGPGPTIYIENS